MARGRSRVEKGSDIHALHPFLVFFFSYLFSFLGGLEPTHTPRWLCSQVDMPHVECKDQDPQDLPALGESKERQQGEESREDEAGRGSARSQVSSPSIATSSANRQLMMLEGKSGSYFSSLDSSIDILKKRAQELIENINESRQKDHALMTNFRDSLKIKVSDLTEKLEERMYQIYNHHNKIIQDKLQEFTQKMAKISHLETELKQVCHTVETVYKDLCVQPEATTSEEQAHKDGEF
ncbi:synaptonemal complex central element protein 2 isoform X6 [Lutra lutra]|uniref:synaptonemal complex central element protein 2 isoform X6 n=1 Tax=Lutra lutra TaxID=9657 RepID=UPI001FD41281|nr:synaptonemal complex central element protein 2 isoform X6 [Lutra lutra]